MRKFFLVFLIFNSSFVIAQSTDSLGFTNKAEARNEYKDSLKEGKWIEYLDSAYKVTTNPKSPYYALVFYKDDTVKGVKRFYSLSGTLLDETPYLHGVRHGLVKEYYDDGKLDGLFPYINGKENGTVKTYYENGNLKFEDDYVDGIREGLYKTYYPDGKLKTITEYTNDEEGSTKTFDENGNEYDPNILQDTVHSNCLSLGAKKAGIGFGNSFKYSGIRFNVYDHDVYRINGFNFNLMHYGCSNLNGMSLSLLDVETQDEDFSSCNGVCFGAIAEFVNQINGIEAGLFCGGNTVNGIAIGGLAGALKFNGIGAGLVVGGTKLNGLFAGLIVLVLDTSYGRLNGLSLGVFSNVVSNANGLQIGVYNEIHTQKGLSVGLINTAHHLHGVQIGLLNHAQNNPPLLRWLPLLNMHFGKDQSIEIKAINPDESGNEIK